MGKEDNRRRFSEQCFSIAEQFEDFDPEEAVSNDPRAEHIEYDPEVLVKQQQEQADGLREQVLDGLEQRAIELRRKTAFRGWRKILEDADG